MLTRKMTTLAAAGLLAVSLSACAQLSEEDSARIDEALARAQSAEQAAQRAEAAAQRAEAAAQRAAQLFEDSLAK